MGAEGGGRPVLAVGRPLLRQRLAARDELLGSIDQAALTGESLPVSKKIGDEGYSGSIAKKGEMSAVVIGTGNNTFFGRTASLVAGAGRGARRGEQKSKQHKRES